MPAFLETIWLDCAHEDCTRSAAVKLYGWNKVYYGQFCRTHGEQTLKQVLEDEKEEREKAEAAAREHLATFNRLPPGYR